jgi:hypothetical protein
MSEGSRSCCRTSWNRSVLLTQPQGAIFISCLCFLSHRSTVRGWYDSRPVSLFTGRSSASRICFGKHVSWYGSCPGLPLLWKILRVCIRSFFWTLTWPFRTVSFDLALLTVRNPQHQFLTPWSLVDTFEWMLWIWLKLYQYFRSARAWCLACQGRWFRRGT